MQGISRDPRLSRSRSSFLREPPTFAWTRALCQQEMFGFWMSVYWMGAITVILSLPTHCPDHWDRVSTEINKNKCWPPRVSFTIHWHCESKDTPTHNLPSGNQTCFAGISFIDFVPTKTPFVVDFQSPGLATSSSNVSIPHPSESSRMPLALPRNGGFPSTPRLSKSDLSHIMGINKLRASSSCLVILVIYPMISPYIHICW